MLIYYPLSFAILPTLFNLYPNPNANFSNKNHYLLYLILTVFIIIFYLHISIFIYIHSFQCKQSLPLIFIHSPLSIIFDFFDHANSIYYLFLFDVYYLIFINLPILSFCADFSLILGAHKYLPVLLCLADLYAREALFLAISHYPTLRLLIVNTIGIFCDDLS